MNEIEELKHENKKLKQSNRILLFYALMSIVIMIYNYYIT
jgi:hypothetical protein